MKILVTGAGGMLGTDVCRALKSANHEVVATGRHGQSTHLDITDFDESERVIMHADPDAVIHCAAYTMVDLAESEEPEAFRINEQGTRNVGIVCGRLRIPLCAVSTDYVFDGQKPEPYTPLDETNPINAYGRSKLAAERAIEEVCPRHWIVRTSWLFGLHGPCFPNTILKAAETRPELQVVNDQHGCPTYTTDLARALTELVGITIYGTLHITNSGATTWYRFADELVRLAGHKEVKVTPVTSDQWPTPACRPKNSVLQPSHLQSLGITPLRQWQEAAEEYVVARSLQTR